MKFINHMGRVYVVLAAIKGTSDEDRQALANAFMTRNSQAALLVLLEDNTAILADVNDKGATLEEIDERIAKQRAEMQAAGLAMDEAARLKNKGSERSAHERWVNASRSIEDLHAMRWELSPL